MVDVRKKPVNGVEDRWLILGAGTSPCLPIQPLRSNFQPDSEPSQPFTLDRSQESHQVSSNNERGPRNKYFEEAHRSCSEPLLMGFPGVAMTVSPGWRNTNRQDPIILPILFSSLGLVFLPWLSLLFLCASSYNGQWFFPAPRIPLLLTS